MKIGVTLALAILLLAAPASATPPSKVTLAWNAETQTLTVTADHFTLDPKAHFIKTIVVVVDGQEVTTKTLTSQTSNKQQVVEIPLPGLKPGAVIVATAQCNLFGKLDGKLTLN